MKALLKFFTGVFVTLLIVAGAILGILALWGIHIIDLKFILKLVISAGVIGITSILVWLIAMLFFKKGIDKE